MVFCEYKIRFIWGQKRTQKYFHFCFFRSFCIFLYIKTYLLTYITFTYTQIFPVTSLRIWKTKTTITYAELCVFFIPFHFGRICSIRFFFWFWKCEKFEIKVIYSHSLCRVWERCCYSGKLFPSMRYIVDWCGWWWVMMLMMIIQTNLKLY